MGGFVRKNKEKKKKTANLKYQPKEKAKPLTATEEIIATPVTTEVTKPKRTPKPKKEIVSKTVKATTPKKKPSKKTVEVAKSDSPVESAPVMSEQQQESAPIENKQQPENAANNNEQQSEGGSV